MRAALGPDIRLCILRIHAVPCGYQNCVCARAIIIASRRAIYNLLLTIGHRKISNEWNQQLDTDHPAWPGAQQLDVGPCTQVCMKGVRDDCFPSHRHNGTPRPEKVH